MPEIFELQKVKSPSVEIPDDAYSWKVELPDSVKRENSLSENSYLVLTVYDGKISGELINITSEIRAETERLTKKYRNAFEEMKRLGD